MSINPPYRFDPLQNPIDVADDIDSDSTDLQFEGVKGAGATAFWLFSPGDIGGGLSASDGPGTLRIRRAGSSGSYTEVDGIWSNTNSTTPGQFTNDGTGAYFPVGSIPGTSGSINVININGEDRTLTPALYDFSGATFTQGGGRTFVVDSVSGGIYDTSNAGNIPRSVSFNWIVTFKQIS